MRGADGVHGSSASSWTTASTAAHRETSAPADLAACAGKGREKIGAAHGKACGLVWRQLPGKPRKGRELHNASLADALKSRTAFTRDDLESFGIKDLLWADFIRSGDTYFQVDDGLPDMSQERTTWRRNKPPSTSTKPVFRLTTEQATHWLGQRRARAATDALHAWNVVMSHHPDGRALADLSDAQLRWWGVEDEEERVAVLEEISGYQADILESQSSLLAGDCQIFQSLNPKRACWRLVHAPKA